MQGPRPTPQSEEARSEHPENVSLPAGGVQWLRAHAFQSLFILTLALGIFARIWEFGRLPPGLNADEATIGLEAWSLFHLGIDRNGLSWPVQFISFGSGQNVLYGYTLIPFVGLLGLRAVVVRLPMLILGIFSLALLYAVGKAIAGRRFGLLAMFLLSISPWHILLSRWGLESNTFPFVFLIAFLCLLRSRSGSHWFVLACTLLGVCLYAYWTAYAVVPVFMTVILIIMMKNRILRGRTIAAGLAAFGLVATPIALLLVVNTLDLATVRLGPITIPNLPVSARYESATLLDASHPLQELSQNLRTAASMLVRETDGLLYNVVDPFGVFYRISLLLGALGLAAMIVSLKNGPDLGIQLLWAWLGASFVVPLFQAVNINRFNIVFMPLLLCGAFALLWLGRHRGPWLAASIGVLLVAFAAFTAVYHGDAYRRQADWKFNYGLLSALHSVRESGAARVCVTDKITMPYVFVLFEAPIDPAEFLRTVQYVDPTEPLRRVRSFGRYTFGTRYCLADEPYTYVLTASELTPPLGHRYDYTFFDNFVVYSPRQ